jgi:hypothetical protein
MIEIILCLLTTLLVSEVTILYLNTDFYLRNKISILLDEQKKSYKDYHDLEELLLNRQKLLEKRIEKFPIGSDKFCKTKKKLQANSDTREQIQEELNEIEKENKV